MALKAFADGAVFGVRHGSGPARVLALHGWRRTAKDFDAVLDGLDAIALDLPGFGSTPAPDTALTTAEYAAAIAPVLDEAAGPVVVVGHSFGGRVAVHLAADRPDAVAALVLTGVPLVRPPGHQPTKAPLGFRLAKALNRIGLLPDARMEKLRRARGSADYNAAEGVLRDILVKAVNETYEDPLGRLRCPVELVWGDGDTAAPPSVAHAAAALVRPPATANVTVLPGVDHFVPQRDPAALRAAVERYLS